MPADYGSPNHFQRQEEQTVLSVGKVKEGTLLADPEPERGKVKRASRMGLELGYQRQSSHGRTLKGKLVLGRRGKFVRQK